MHKGRVSSAKIVATSTDQERMANEYLVNKIYASRKVDTKSGIVEGTCN